MRFGWPSLPFRHVETTTAPARTRLLAMVSVIVIPISLLFATHLTFALAPVYVVAMGISALLIWQVTGDGEAAEFEGWALVAVYVIIGAITLYQ